MEKLGSGALRWLSAMAVIAAAGCHAPALLVHAGAPAHASPVGGVAHPTRPGSLEVEDLASASLAANPTFRVQDAWGPGFVTENTIYLGCSPGDTQRGLAVPLPSDTGTLTIYAWDGLESLADLGYAEPPKEPALGLLVDGSAPSNITSISDAVYVDGDWEVAPVYLGDHRQWGPPFPDDSEIQYDVGSMMQPSGNALTVENVMGQPPPGYCEWLDFAIYDTSEPRPTPSPPPKVTLSGHFTPDTVTPLRDRQTSFADASTTTLVIQASGPSVPAQMTVHLAASVDPHSGGHEEDATDRPVGRFLLPDGSAATQTDLTLTDGYGKIAYRSSGFGGTDIVGITADSASPISVDLPVKFALVDLGEDGSDRATTGWDCIHHVHLVGWTAAHPYHHYCLPALRQVIWDVAAKFFSLSGQDLEINDESLPGGGPFDLGPDYRVPWWYLGCCHINHRDGDSADMPIANRSSDRGTDYLLRHLLAFYAKEAGVYLSILQEPLPGEGVLPHWHIQIRN